MNCPYCNFQFEKLILVGADRLPPYAPLLCHSCLKIVLLDHGEPRKVSQIELEEIQKSPAYIQVLAPLTAQIKERNRRLAMHQNG